MEIGRLPDDLTVCASGSASNLADVARRLHTAGPGSENAARNLHGKLIDEALLLVAHLNHGSEPLFAGNEIHYVNGYRNGIAERYGLETREDHAVSPGVTTAENRACTHGRRRRTA